MIDIRIKDDLFFEIDKGNGVITYPRLAYAEIKTNNRIDLVWINSDDANGLYSDLKYELITVDGVAFTDIYELQTALTEVLFNQASGGGGSTIDLSIMEGLLTSIDTKLNTLNNGLATEIKQDSQITELQTIITDLNSFIGANNTGLNNILNKNEEVRLAINSLQPFITAVDTTLTSFKAQNSTDFATLNTSLTNLRNENSANLTAIQTTITSKVDELKALNQAEFDQTQLAINQADTNSDNFNKRVFTPSITSFDKGQWSDGTAQPQPLAVASSFQNNLRSITFDNRTNNKVLMSYNGFDFPLNRGESLEFTEQESRDMGAKTFTLTPVAENIYDGAGNLLYNGISEDGFETLIATGKIALEEPIIHLYETTLISE